MLFHKDGDIFPRVRARDAGNAYLWPTRVLSNGIQNIKVI